MWRLAYSIPLWLAYSAVALVLWIVGSLIIPVMAWRQSWDLRPSFAYAERRPVTCWRARIVDRVWGNAEDGVTGAKSLSGNVIVGTYLGRVTDTVTGLTADTPTFTVTTIHTDTT